MGNFFKWCDIYSVHPSEKLSFNSKNEKIPTIMGGICTLILMIGFVIAVSFYIKPIIDKKHIKSITI